MKLIHATDGIMCDLHLLYGILEENMSVNNEVKPFRVVTGMDLLYGFFNSNR